jgi:hypothetical protein
MATISKVDTVAVASIAKVNTIESASIASINTIPWDAVGGGGEFYNGIIDQSCMFNGPSATYLGTTSTDNSDTTCTHSVWIKRTNASSTAMIYSMKEDSDDYGRFGFGSSDQFFLQRKNSGSTTISYSSNAKFDDCSGWYHVVAISDTSNAEAIDRIRIYINNVRITSWSTENRPSQNESAFMCRAASRDRNIGRRKQDSENYFDGYMAEYNYIDGSTLLPSDFGELKQGIWIPKTYAGAYPNNSHRLTFADNTHFGDDTSGNANDWTDNNFGTDHQSPDTPENNYCILSKRATRSNISSLQEGGLSPRDGGTAWHTAMATWVLKTGKWYWEVDIGGDADDLQTGLVASGEKSGDIIISDDTPANTPYGWGFHVDNSNDTYKREHNNSVQNDDNLDEPAADDVMTVAYDADTGKIWFGLYNVGSGHVWGDFNGEGVGDPANGNNPTYTVADRDHYDLVPFISIHAHSVSLVNFGQAAFSGTKPSGFNILCADNIPEPDIMEASETAFNNVLYEGTGAEHAITGVGFQPDLVWIKNRDVTDNQMWFNSDSGATKFLESNSSDDEATDAQTLKSFDADGFTLGTNEAVNTDGENFIAWCWKKGSAYGFDIQTYTGTGANQAVAHDLGVKPEMIIFKNLGDTTAGAHDWNVYHHHARNKADPETDYGRLNDSSPAWTDQANRMDDTAPTTTHFTVGSADVTNKDTDTILAYLFASIPGFSHVFSYQGNGNSNGPSTYCGFRPEMIFFKNSEGSGDDWKMIDNARSPDINPTSFVLQPSRSLADAASSQLYFYANGFKIRGTTSGYNNNNQTIVGIAFAQQPFKYSNAR